MCEFCSAQKSSLRALTREEREEAVCEWRPDDGGEEPTLENLDEEEPAELVCGDPATHMLYDWFVEEHLCEQHAEEQKGELEDGLDELLELSGFPTQTEFLPITSGETCEYFDLVTGESCAQTAKRAKYVLSDMILCDEHAADITESPS